MKCCMCKKPIEGSQKHYDYSFYGNVRIICEKCRSSLDNLYSINGKKKKAGKEYINNLLTSNQYEPDINYELKWAMGMHISSEEKVAAKNYVKQRKKEKQEIAEATYQGQLKKETNQFNRTAISSVGMFRFSCPKCGGMYLKDGRCAQCGFVFDESRANRASQTENTNSPVQENTDDGLSANMETVPLNSQSASIPKTLMVCPDCGKWISKDAITCPQCGCVFPGNMGKVAKQTQPRQSKSGTGVIGIIFAVVIGGLILWYLMAPYTTPLWLQHIGGTIKALFEGKDTYTIFDPSRIGR